MNFYYLIKNEVINMKNNFSELFKLNDSKYAYHPSCFVKDNSLTESIIKNDEPIKVCQCASYKLDRRLRLYEFNIVLQNIISFINKYN